ALRVTGREERRERLPRRDHLLPLQLEDRHLPLRRSPEPEPELRHPAGAADLLMSRARRRQRGQALVELAISVPVLLWLLLGSFDASVLVSDKVIAGYATRQGARLAAEIGGSETNNPPATQTSIDQNVV